MKRWVDFIGGKMWLDPEASEFEALMAAGKWEHRKVALLQKYLKPGMVFVDAGAHWGYFSLIAANLGARVMAFEPDRENAAMISRNVHQNPDFDIHYYAFGLWNKRSELPLYSGYNEATNSVIKNHGRGEKTIRVYPLSEFSGFYDPPDIIKIDVEGADVQVLQGASGTFDYASNVILLMDLHPELGVHNEDVGKLLRAHGFRLYDIRSDNAPIETIPPTMVELLAIKGHNA